MMHCCQWLWWSLVDTIMAMAMAMAMTMRTAIVHLHHINKIQIGETKSKLNVRM
jgi:hypothetical protein